jgi:transcriptional regulator GlxA family with amidase domain
MPQRVIIVVYDTFQTLDATGPAEVFANARRNNEPFYQVELCSWGGGERVSSSGLRMQTKDLARLRLQRSDTVVVAGAEEGPILREMANAALLQWLRRADRSGARMASVCSGAFILAAAGLLHGKRVATHWLGCEQLAALFPNLHVDRNAIFVQDGNLWTSAGVTTGIDMALAIVEQDLDRTTADQIAAVLVLYVRRPGYQSQFSQALIAQTADSDELAPAMTWARAHLGEADVESLARRARLSVRTLHRRCLEQLGVTPAKLIDKLRIEQARTLLTTSSLSMKLLSERCGFGSAAHMQRSFQRELGMGPRDYRVLHSPRAAHSHEAHSER